MTAFPILLVNVAHPPKLTERKGRDARETEGDIQFMAPAFPLLIGYQLVGFFHHLLGPRITTRPWVQIHQGPAIMGQPLWKHELKIFLLFELISSGGCYGGRKLSWFPRGGGAGAMVVESWQRQEKMSHAFHTLIQLELILWSLPTHFAIGLNIGWQLHDISLLSCLRFYIWEHPASS